MRKVEFRAWDKKRKEMLSSNCVNLAMFLNGELYEIDCNDNISTVDDLVVMQYTGLKDENGVKIYEGDIVLNRVTDLSGGELKMCEVIGVVKVSRGMTYVVGKQLQYEEYELESSTNYNCLLLSPEIFKVITNIYDNPELLKGY